MMTRHMQGGTSTTRRSGQCAHACSACPHSLVNQSMAPLSAISNHLQGVISVTSNIIPGLMAGLMAEVRVAIFQQRARQPAV